MRESVDVFLTQTGAVRTGETYQQDEFSGFAVRSVDLYYNSPIAAGSGKPLEDTFQKAFATAVITDRSVGSNWVMPIFMDVDPARDAPLMHGGEIKVGDTVRFGSTAAGGSSPYCTVLEKVPVTFLLNREDTAACVEYQQGYGEHIDTYEGVLNGLGSASFVRTASQCRAAKTLSKATSVSGTVNMNDSTSRFSHANTSTFKTWDNFIMLRDADGKAGDQLTNYNSSPFFPNDSTYNWAGYLTPAVGTSTHTVKICGAYVIGVLQATAELIHPGMVADIEVSTNTVTRCRILNVRGHDGSQNVASTHILVELAEAVGHDTPGVIIGLNGINDHSAWFHNLTRDAACYAYRINRTLNLTTIPAEKSASSQSIHIPITQATVNKGGIEVAGEYRPEAVIGNTLFNSNSSKVYDSHNNRHHFTTSTVLSKWDWRNHFKGVPFLRQKVIDQERCFFPMYRQLDWSRDRLSHDHPLRVRFDYDTKEVSKITLTAYSVFGKRQVDKEDAGQLPDDDYFILRFREVQGKTVSNNPNADRAFGIIKLGGDASTPETVGAQEYAQALSDDGVIVLNINPPKKIQMLTLDVLDRDGNPAHFGRIHLWLKLEVNHC